MTKNTCGRLSIPLVVGLGFLFALILAWSAPSAWGSSLVLHPWNRLGETLTHTLYLPAVASRESGLFVNPQDRRASLDFYNQVYRASEGASIDWTGDHATCDQGITSALFRDAVQLRINYFRAMAGVPADVVLLPEYNQKAQKAALMMSVNHQLSHKPPDTWTCYSADGAQAAGSSNLYLGVYAWAAIDGYIRDPGSGNYPVGHRRWILYPQTQSMGTGDLPPANGYWAANALWVFDAHIFGPRPDTREAFVAWPPPGYVPYPVVYPRWSFSYAGADLTAATVVMTAAGAPLAVSQRPVVEGYGENTLVWEPNATFASSPSADRVYSVSIRNVLIDSHPHDFDYDVIVFDPDDPSPTPMNARVNPGRPPVYAE